MRVVRRSNLAPLIVSVDEQYEFSVEALINAINLHPDADVVCDNNPNGRVTAEAQNYAEHAGKEVMKLRDLYARLHRE